MFENFDLCLTVAEAVKIEGLPYEITNELQTWSDKAFRCSDQEYENLCSEAVAQIGLYGVGDKWSRELISLWRASGGDPENRLGIPQHLLDLSPVESSGVQRKSPIRGFSRPAISGKKKVLSGGLGGNGQESRPGSGLFG